MNIVSVTQKHFRIKGIVHRPISRLVSLWAAAAGAISVSGCGKLSVTRALAVGPNVVSHQLCSATFVAGLDPESYYREAIAPSLGIFNRMARYRIDFDKREVTATLAGGFVSRAVYRGAEGCLVVQGAVREPAASPLPASAVVPSIAGPEVVAPTDPALIAAVDGAFAEPGVGGQLRQSRAVVIVHDGRVVAERYAAGYGVETPMLGWSMTKSVTNALLGVLVRQGKISISGPAPVAAWSDPKDPHHAISIDNMLRMTSGLDFGQSLTQNWATAFDPTAQMVFATPDMAAVAERAGMKTAPGAAWRYSNGNTMILSRMIRDSVGGDAAAVLTFAHRELFNPLGMTHSTLEFDAAGTPLGATHLWAPARDWARFGLLYLADGVAGGKRILPEGWVDYSARPTPGSEAYGYGAGFWTNRGDPSAVLPPHRRPDMPPDSFMAYGSLGQYVVIVPSARLVIVRMGVSRMPGEDIEGIDRLTADSVAVFGGR